MENLEYLEKSENYFWSRNFCSTIVFIPSLSIHMSSHLCGLSKTAGKIVRKVWEFLKIRSGKSGKVREFFLKQS